MISITSILCKAKKNLLPHDHEKITRKTRESLQVQEKTLK